MGQEQQRATALVDGGYNYFATRIISATVEDIERALAKLNLGIPNRYAHHRAGAERALRLALALLTQPEPAIEVRRVVSRTGGVFYVADGPSGYSDLLKRLTPEAALRDGLAYFKATRVYSAAHGCWVIADNVQDCEPHYSAWRNGVQS